MLDTIVQYSQQPNVRLIITIVSVAFLWVFVRSSRWIINFILIVVFIGYMLWQIPTLQQFLRSLTG